MMSLNLTFAFVGVYYPLKTKILAVYYEIICLIPIVLPSKYVIRSRLKWGVNDQKKRTKHRGWIGAVFCRVIVMYHELRSST